MRVSTRWFLILFLVASVADFTTTIYGIRFGFSEANPVLAARLENLWMFTLTYLVYTVVGLALLWFTLKMTKFSPAFGIFAGFFVLLKTLPAVNNSLLLAGIQPTSFAFTAVRWLLRLV